mgnify:CR=1 FL=1
MTIIKKTIPKTTGETILPNNIPNLNHILFNGDKIDELNKPKIKKTIDRIIDQVLIFPLLNNGNIPTSKKKTKKTIPKLLFDPIFIFSFSNLNK